MVDWLEYVPYKRHFVTFLNLETFQIADIDLTDKNKKTLT